MRKVLLVLALAVAACGGDDDAPSADDESLVDMCVRRTVELYEKHDLPFTRPESERPAICEDFLDENEVTTKAQLEVQMRQFDKELAALAED